MKEITYEVDIKNINFKDNFFDYILAIHVLEHIDDDSQALRELYRVLKPGGKVILMVPFMHQYKQEVYLRSDGTKMLHISKYDNKTFEIPGTRTPEECFDLYGQSNHLRIYGLADFQRRLEEHGFSVHLARAEHLPEKFKKETNIVDDIVFAHK